MKKFMFKNLLIAFILLFSSLAQAMEVPEPLQKVNGIYKDDSRVFISGLPGADDYSNFAKAGVEVIINLMDDSQNVNYTNEAELVKQAGIKYIYIPVDWNNPTMENVDQFFVAMKENQDKQLLIHCFSGIRASAFYYLYLKNQTDNNPNISKIMKPWGADVAKRLDEFPKWKKLIADVEMKYKK